MTETPPPIDTPPAAPAIEPPPYASPPAPPVIVPPAPADPPGPGAPPLTAVPDPPALGTGAPAAAPADAFSDRVIALLTEDTRTAAIVPMVAVLIKALAPTMGVTEEEVADPSSPGLRQFLEAIADAVKTARAEDGLAVVDWYHDPANVPAKLDTPSSPNV